MKKHTLFLILLLTTFGAVAQTKKPATPPPPTTTTTPSATSTELNRQQLYDQYHGADANKKGDKKPSNMDSSPKRESAPKPEKVARVKSASSGEEHSRFGIRGGLNLANVTQGGQSADMLLGFHGGIIYNISVSDAFSIQPELLYSVKGAKDKASGVEGKINTIELPLLFKYKFGQSNTKFFVNAGGFGAYVLNVNGTAPTETTVEYGVTGGVGVELPAGSSKLLIEGRYDYGLGVTNTKQFTATDYHLTVIGISVGYLF